MVDALRGVLVLRVIVLVVIGFGFVRCLWVVCYGVCVVVVCWFCLRLAWLVDGCEYLRLGWCFLLYCWFGGLCCCGYFRLIVLLLCGSLFWFGLLEVTCLYRVDLHVWLFCFCYCV